MNKTEAKKKERENNKLSFMKKEEKMEGWKSVMLDLDVGLL